MTEHSTDDGPRLETPADLISRWRARAMTCETAGDSKAAYHLRFAADELQGALSAWSLPVRMREAADTLEEATKRYFAVRDSGAGDREILAHPDHHDWRPVNLRYVADRFEEEDA